MSTINPPLSVLLFLFSLSSVYCSVSAVPVEGIALYEEKNPESILLL